MGWIPRSLWAPLTEKVMSFKWKGNENWGGASMIPLLIRFGSQPFPLRKRTNLNVSVSPIGFFQNVRRISFGHDFNEKKASSSISLTNCLLSSTSSARDSRRISPRNRLNVAIMRPFWKVRYETSNPESCFKYSQLKFCHLPSTERFSCLNQPLFNAITLAIVSDICRKQPARICWLVRLPSTLSSRSRAVVQVAVNLA